ncbi:MAG: TonB-dependent receptor [Ignavibacteria bacterium]|nr:TonB-dependent receptor [Ignavibacteria bacterium]
MKKLFLLIVLLLFPLKIFSQEPDSLFYFPVLINDSNQYVPKVEIQIVEQNKKEIKAAFTNLLGTASFFLARGKNYSLIISDTSYSKIKKKFSTETNAGFLSDTIYLHPKTVTTDVINVEADKDFMRMEDDKMIFDISKMKVNPGPNALELMKKIPMVTVEGDNVLLRGNSPKILINGRESEMYGDLKSLPTELVEKVEVMTVAPSKYEAEGVNGVINIVLKKFEDAKYRVFLSGWGSSNRYANTYQSMNYKKNKVSLFLNTSERYSDPKYYSYSYNKKISTGGLLVNSTDTSGNISKSLRVNPGIIYDADKNFYFGVEGVLNLSGLNGSSSSFKEYSYLPGQVQQLFRSNNNDNKDYSIVAYINKQEMTGKDELNLEFNLNNTSYNSNYNQTQFINNIYTPFTNGNSEIKNNNQNIKLDYTKKFSDDLKLETGIKSVYKKEMNDNFSADTSGSYSAGYEFTQKIYSYYGTLSYNTKTFRFKPGLRIEYADLRGLVNGASEFANFKFDIFPSLSVTQFLSDNTQLQLSYSKKIERPRFNSLNPFVIRRDIYNTTIGNPDLLPSYTHSFEFRINKPFNKNYLNANFYFKRNVDLIQNLRYIDSIYTRSVYLNYGYSDDFGVDGSFRISLNDFWNANVYGRVGKKVYSEDSLNASSDRVSLNGNFWGGYSNPDVIDANVSFYCYKQNSALSVGELFTSLNLSFGKNFLDKKLYIGISLDDLLNKTSSEYTYVKDGYEQFSRYSGGMGRSVSINFSFTFGNYDEKRQKGKDIKGDDYGE